MWGGNCAELLPGGPPPGGPPSGGPSTGDLLLGDPISGSPPTIDPLPILPLSPCSSLVTLSPIVDVASGGGLRLVRNVRSR